MNFVLSFSAEDLRILNMALLETPTKFGAPLIAKINEQINAQQEERMKSSENSVNFAEISNLGR